MGEKYLFFDMDGTLISRKDRKILKSTVEALHHAMENGHHVFLCTGRSLSMALEYKDVIDIPGIVFSNGGGIAYNGEILQTYDIAQESIVRIQDVVEHLGGGYQLLTPHYVYQNAVMHESFRKQFAKDYQDRDIDEVMKMRTMVPMSQYQGEPVQKVDIRLADGLIGDLGLAYLPRSLHVISQSGYFAGMGSGAEITSARVTKATGIRHVIDLFHANMEDTFAFGDSGNDIEMIKAAHTGIAMGNATDETKAIADYITDDCDSDGIYHAMKHFELI